MADKFYDEFGRIADKDVAHEVANLEKPARDRELELKRQVGVGLTKEQEGNVALMADLKAKYPDAFIGHVDDKGREVLVLKLRIPLPPPEEQERDIVGGRVFVFTQNGAFGIQERTEGRYWTVWSDLDLNKITDIASGPPVSWLGDVMMVPVHPVFGKDQKLTTQMLAYVKSFSLAELISDRVAKPLSKILATADESGRKQRERAAQRIPTVRTLLQKL
mgnify:CR=1 FL=1